MGLTWKKGLKNAFFLFSNFQDYFIDFMNCFEVGVFSASGLKGITYGVQVIKKAAGPVE